jgi:hypothetical protein
MKYIKRIESKYTGATKFALLALGLVIVAGSTFAQTDPGPRGGAPGAGAPIGNLSPDQARFFATALSLRRLKASLYHLQATAALGPHSTETLARCATRSQRSAARSDREPTSGASNTE